MTQSTPHVPEPMPEPSPEPTPRPRPARATATAGEPGPLRRSVAQHIKILQDGYARDGSQAVQALARLRRGIGRQANELPELWGIVGIEGFYAAQPDGRHPSEYEALRAERATHVAMTLWALHQQSNRARAMHVGDGTSLGAAVRRLMSGSDRDEAIHKRLVRAGTATSFDVLAHRLRELVVLLRKAEIPLDYGLLAEQLDEWQKPGGPRVVRQAWGRSFHAYRPAVVGGQQDGDSREETDNGITEYEMKDQT
ncbi:type I-E CRISPR-associated protein Cse2/CasB [Streptomyces sp. NPDC004667]|uniref:type I-E CRISPR-associated protein Cse2/CasB n=1 Tax=Streptomyces sp. NPDC004667 TaxID=3154285 RepID=UPI0033BB0C42